MINPPGVASASRNGFAGKPAMSGLGRYYELDVTVTGTPEPSTGYLVNIKTIDAAAHASIVPAIGTACERRPEVEPAVLLPELIGGLADSLKPHSLDRVLWRLTPTYCVEIRMGSTDSVVIRQRFDFAAAHRLHVASLSDADNEATFGKCNNPNGHGHNYVLEPAVEVSAAAPMRLDQLERLVEEVILDRFDHTHLNKDTPEFGEAEGVNPSVEHISRVFFELLAPPVSEAGGRLVEMTVWETDRTSSTYCPPA